MEACGGFNAFATSLELTVKYSNTSIVYSNLPKMQIHQRFQHMIQDATASANSESFLNVLVAYCWGIPRRYVLKFIGVHEFFSIFVGANH